MLWPSEFFKLFLRPMCSFAISTVVEWFVNYLRIQLTLLNLFFFFSIVVILSPFLFPLFLFLLSSKRELILKFFPSSTVGRMNPKTLRSLNLLCVISGLTAKPIYSKGDFTSTITQFRLGMYVVTEQNSHLPSSFHLTFQSLSVLDWILFTSLCVHSVSSSSVKLRFKLNFNK